MCKLGDIIVVNNYIGDDGKEIGRHSFIVVDDNPNSISGLDYNLVTTVISSFKSEKQKIKKLSQEGNKEIHFFELVGKVIPFNKPSYIKADKLFYFNKKKLDYYVFGRISDDLLDELMELINHLSVKDNLTIITDNL